MARGSCRRRPASSVVPRQASGVQRGRLASMASPPRHRSRAPVPNPPPVRMDAPQFSEIYDLTLYVLTRRHARGTYHANVVYDPFRCVFESQFAQICGQIDFKSQFAFGICNKNTFSRAGRLERRNGIGHRGLWSGIRPLSRVSALLLGTQKVESEIVRPHARRRVEEDSGLGFQVRVLGAFEVIPCSLRSGYTSLMPNPLPVRSYRQTLIIYKKYSRRFWPL